LTTETNPPAGAHPATKLKENSQMARYKLDESDARTIERIKSLIVDGGKIVTIMMGVSPSFKTRYYYFNIIEDGLLCNYSSWIAALCGLDYSIKRHAIAISNQSFNSADYLISCIEEALGIEIDPDNIQHIA
jgi:hypothetical protein